MTSAGVFVMRGFFPFGFAQGQNDKQEQARAKCGGPSTAAANAALHKVQNIPGAQRRGTWGTRRNDLTTFLCGMTNKRTGNRKCKCGDSSPSASLRVSDCLGLSRRVGGKDGARRLGKRSCVFRFPTTTTARFFYAATDEGPVIGVASMRLRTSRALALRRTSSLWARAMRTTLPGLPAARRRFWKRMKSGS